MSKSSGNYMVDAQDRAEDDLSRLKRIEIEEDEGEDEEDIIELAEGEA